jgi:hypothetical protein
MGCYLIRSPGLFSFLGSWGCCWELDGTAKRTNDKKDSLRRVELQYVSYTYSNPQVQPPSLPKVDLRVHPSDVGWRSSSISPYGNYFR